MLTKNAVGNLINRYKAVLDNCRLLNVLGALALAASVAMPTTANAYTIPETQDAAYTVTAGAIATDETSTAPYYIIFTDKVADADGNITETKYGIQLNKSLVNSTPDLTQTAGDAAINDLILAYDDGTYTIIAGTEEDKTFSLTLPSDTYYFKVMNDTTKVETAIRPESGYNGIFIGNGGTNGGAIENYGTIASITNSTFIGNSADYNGGAISNSGTITTIKDSTFIGNSAGTSGGAIYNFGAIDDIENTTFIGNTAGTSGGAIYNWNTITNGITNSTFIGNSAGTFGGAIDNSGTIGSITNSTFIGNVATKRGGAIYNWNTITNGITNSTFIGNSADYGGAIYTTKDLTFNANDGGKVEFTDNMAGTCENTDFNAIYVAAAGKTLTFNLAGNGNVYMNDGIRAYSDKYAYNVAITGTDSTGAFYLNDAMEDVGSLTLSNATLTLGSFTHGDDTTTVGTIIAQNLTVNSGGKVTATEVTTNIGGTAGDDATGVYAKVLTINSGGLYNATGKTLTVYDGGKVDASATEVSTYIGATKIDKNTIKGISAGNLDVQDGGFYDAHGQTVTVSGGTVTVAEDTVIGGTAEEEYTSLHANSLTVSGGTYTTTGYTEIYSDLTVSDGTYTANKVTTVYDGGELTVSGGTYTANSTTSVYGGGDLTVDGGTYEATSTTVEGGTFEVADGTYTATGDTTVTDGTFKVSGGTCTSDSLSVSGGTFEIADGTYETTGNTAVSSGTFTVSGGTYTSRGDTSASGTFTVSDGTYTAESITVVYGTLKVSGGTYEAKGSTNVTTGTFTVSGGIYAMGSADAAWVSTAVTDAGLTAKDYAILAIAKADMLSINNDSTLNVGNVGGSPAYGAHFGDGSLLVLDGSQFTGGTYALDTVYTIDVAEGATLLIASNAVELVDGTATVKVAKADTKLDIAKGAWGYDGAGDTETDPEATDIIDTDTIFTDSQLLGVTGVDYDEAENTYVVTLGSISVVAGYEDGASLDKDLAKQIDSLDTKDPAYDFFANTNAKGAHGVVTMGVNGGSLPSMGLVGSSATANVQAHNSLTVAESPTATYLAMNGDGIVLPSTSREMTKGFGIWAMPMYKHSSADDFASGNQEYGFDANIYGMTLGADYTFDSNLRLGAALHVGTGTAENSGDLPDTENDFDYFGMTAYAAKHFDNLALNADLGFTASSNDIQQAGGLKADSDVMLFTAGIKAEYLFDFKSFELTPYVGARINHYELDDFDTKLHGARQVRNYASDATIVEFPIGLAIATDLQSGDWTLTPSASLGVKFAAGDLEADQEYSLGNSADKAIMTSEIADAVTFQGTLGLGMKKDVYSIDLGYTLDMSEHVQSHGVTANLRYEF